MGFQKNYIVDYYDNRKISCGLVLEADERRLKVLNDQGKEMRISVNRALTGDRDTEFPISGSREAQIFRLKRISELRDELKSTVDLQDLWAIVTHETREISVDDLSELFFGKSRDHHRTASLLRAIFEDRLYFKILPGMIEVSTPDRVEQILTQRQKETERASFAARSADYLAQLKTSADTMLDVAPVGLVELLEEAAIQGRDWVDFKNMKELFSQAGLSQEWNPLRVLVNLGVWDEDENIRLRAEKIPVEFSPEAEALALQVSKTPFPTGAQDFSDQMPITIDSTTTRDLDDAISLSSLGEDYILGIHIADAGHFVALHSPLDQEIRQRATSIYLPEKTIPMIPPILSEDGASLVAGEKRPTLSLMARFDKNLILKDFQIVPSVITVSERLSYEEADARIRNAGSREAQMFAIATARRRLRMASGALIFRDPEVGVSVSEDKSITVSLRDRESPAQILVSELMILTNSLFAQFLKERNLPGIFRSQSPPLEKIDLGEEYDPVLSYRCKKNLVRGDIGTHPAPHDTLGLDAYTTVTSPLRRYTDLVVQRQIKAFLQNNTTLMGTADLESLLTDLLFRLDRANLVERERHRYFLLKYLAQNKSQELEAVVLHRFPRFYLVQLTSFAVNAALNVPHSVTLNPYDRAIVKIEKINPREDKLTLSLVKLL